MRHRRGHPADAALRMAAVPVCAIGGPQAAPAEGAPYRLGADLLGAIRAFAASFGHGLRPPVPVIRGEWRAGSTVRLVVALCPFSARRLRASGGSTGCAVALAT